MKIRNINKMSKTDFALWNVFFSILLYLYYRLLLFRQIAEISVLASKIIFLLLVAVLVPFGGVVTANRRNWVSIAVNVLLPLEIYTVAVLFVYKPVYYSVIIFVALLLSLIYTMLVLVPKKNEHLHNHRKAVLKKIKFSFQGMRTITASVLLIIIIPFVVRNTFDYGIMSSHVKSNPNDSSSENEWTIDNKLEILSKLQEDEWKKLSIQEKLDVLGVVKNCEIVNLGIPHEIYLEAEKMDNGKEAGGYIDEEHKISLNIDMLREGNSAELCLVTVAHECYHAYECICVDLYNEIDRKYQDLMMFDDIKEYMDNYGNYISGEDDFSLYETQIIEQKARDYSETRRVIYFASIFTYMCNGAND